MKTIVIITAMLLYSVCARPQNPVSWNYITKKISDKIYEIHLTPTVQKPWHIYSQTSPEGGALATTIRFNKNPLVTLVGKTKEVGKIMSKYEDVFEVTVKYFEGRADFVQAVKVKANVDPSTTLRTIISGSVEFMACNNEQCLPPETVKFSVRLE